MKDFIFLVAFIAMLCIGAAACAEFTLIACILSAAAFMLCLGSAMLVFTFDKVEEQL